MSDHYCCKTCGQRYDACKCPTLAKLAQDRVRERPVAVRPDPYRDADQGVYGPEYQGQPGPIGDPADQSTATHPNPAALTEIWTTADGRSIPVAYLTEDHAKRILNMLLRAARIRREKEQRKRELLAMLNEIAEDRAGEWPWGDD